MNDYERVLIALAAKVAEIERKQEGRMARGTVHEVDPEKGTVRLKVGEDDDGKPFLTPPIPYAQTMGALKVHSPPSVGQQMTAFNDGGDYRQGIALPMTQSDANKSPSTKGDEHVMTLGSVTIRVKGDEVFVQRGALSAHFGEEKITFSGPATFKDPVAFEKGFVASAGAEGEAAGTFNGRMHATGEIKSDQRVVAPVLQGAWAGP